MFAIIIKKCCVKIFAAIFIVKMYVIYLGDIRDTSFMKKNPG